MTTPPEAPPLYHWVPENYIFDSAQDCLGAYPNAGPACLVTSHVAYNELKARLEKAEQLLHVVLEAQYCYHDIEEYFKENK